MNNASVCLQSWINLFSLSVKWNCESSIFSVDLYIIDVLPEILWISHGYGSIVIGFSILLSLFRMLLIYSAVFFRHIMKSSAV